MKKKDIIEVIKNFHKVYYELKGDPGDLLILHHAAEHLFDAAEITSSIVPPVENARMIERAQQGLPPLEYIKDILKNIEREQ